MESNLIRSLIASYFGITRQAIQDLVPKAIMHLLVSPCSSFPFSNFWSGSEGAACHHEHGDCSPSAPRQRIARYGRGDPDAQNSYGQPRTEKREGRTKNLALSSEHGRLRAGQLFS